MLYGGPKFGLKNSMLCSLLVPEKEWAHVQPGRHSSRKGRESLFVREFR